MIDKIELYNNLKNEIENLTQYNNYTMIESKLNDYLQLNIEDKVNEFDLKERYLRLEENTCQKVIKECNINIEKTIKQKEETLQNIIITKENAILKMTKTNPIKAFFEKLTNKINGSKKYENRVLQPAKAKILEIEEKSLPQIIEKTYDMAEKDIYDIDIKINNIPDIVRKNTLNDREIIENRIKNVYEFIGEISQKAQMVFQITNMNIEDIVKSILEKIDKKIIEKANEPEKPKIREGYIRESRLDENLLEEITNLYNEDNKKDSNNINNKIDKNVNKEEKEEIIEDKAIEIEKGKKSKEDKKDKFTEDFLNNLETTMREGK